MIQYGKGRSDVFTKLEGVYRPSQAVTDTPAENSIFTAPAVTAPSGGTALSNGTKAVTSGNNPAPAEPAQGTKRRREDESDKEDAPMEEDDDDDDVSMEASSDDDD